MSEATHRTDAIAIAPDEERAKNVVLLPKKICNWMAFLIPIARKESKFLDYIGIKKKGRSQINLPFFIKN